VVAAVRAITVLPCPLAFFNGLEARTAPRVVVPGPTGLSRAGGRNVRQVRAGCATSSCANDSLHWLEAESEKAEWSIEQGDEGQQTRALTVTHLDALVPELRLPSSLRIFASRADLQRRIRSVTACYLDLADFALPAAGAAGKLVHVLSDQQWCRHWLLYVGPDDQEAVLTSTAPIGSELPEDWPGAPPSVIPLDGENDLEVCADSFAEFLYRFWIRMNCGTRLLTAGRCRELSLPTRRSLLRGHDQYVPCFVVVARPLPDRYRRHAAILTGDQYEGRDRRHARPAFPSATSSAYTSPSDGIIGAWSSGSSGMTVEVFDHRSASYGLLRRRFYRPRRCWRRDVTSQCSYRPTGQRSAGSLYSRSESMLGTDYVVRSADGQHKPMLRVMGSPWRPGTNWAEEDFRPVEGMPWPTLMRRIRPATAVVVKTPNTRVLLFSSLGRDQTLAVARSLESIPLGT
jgi:hypothetical protein